MFSRDIIRLEFILILIMSEQHKGLDHTISQKQTVRQNNHVYIVENQKQPSQLQDTIHWKNNLPIGKSKIQKYNHIKQMECHQNCLQFAENDSNQPHKQNNQHQSQPTKIAEQPSNHKGEELNQFDQTTNIDLSEDLKNNPSVSHQHIISPSHKVQMQEDRGIKLQEKSIDLSKDKIEYESKEKEDKRFSNQELSNNQQKLVPQELVRLQKQIQRLSKDLLNQRSQKNLMFMQTNLTINEYDYLYRSLTDQRKKHQEEIQKWNLQKKEEQDKMLIMKQNISLEHALLVELIKSVNPSQEQDKCKQEEITKIKIQLNEQIDDLQKSQNAKTFLELQIQKLKSFLNKQKIDIETLRDKQNNLQAELKEKSDQNLRCQQSISALKKQRQKYNAESEAKLSEAQKQIENMTKFHKQQMDAANKKLQQENIKQKQVQQKYSKSIMDIRKQFQQLLTKVAKQQEQYKNQDKDGQLLILIKKHQKQKAELQHKIGKANAQIDQLKDQINQKKDDYLQNKSSKQEKEKKMQETEQQTKNTANKLMKYLHSSILNSQKDKEQIKDANDKLMKKDAQILTFEMKLQQLEIQIVDLQLKLKISEQERQQLDQQCRNSKQTLSNYQKSMKSYKQQVKAFIQSQKIKFKEALTIATQQFNKSLEDVTTYYEIEIQKEKQNQIKQSDTVREMKQKLNQLEDISGEVKKSSKQILKNQVQTLSKTLTQAARQMKGLKNEVQVINQKLKLQIQRSRQRQQQLKQKISQKQRIQDNLRKQKIKLEDSISKIEEELQDITFQQFAEKLIDSQEYEYHDQIVQLIFCIYSQRCNYETKKYSQSQQQRANKFQSIKQQNQQNQSHALKLQHQKQLKSLKTIIESMETDIAKYKQIIAVKQSDSTTIKKQYESVLAQLENIKSRGKKSQQSSTQLLAQRNQWKVNKQSLQNEVEALKRGARQNKDELRRIKQAYDNTLVRQQKAANDRLNRQTSALQKQISSLKKQRDNAILQKNQLQQKIAQLQADNNKTKNTRDNLYFTQTNRINNEYEIKYKNLQLEYTKYTSKTKELTQKIIQLEKQNKRLKQTPNNQSELQQKSWQKYQSSAKQYEEIIDQLRIQKQNFRKMYQDCEEKLKIKQQEIKKIEVNKRSLQSELMVSPMSSGKQLFVVSTIMQDNIKSQQFLQRIIQQQAKPAKLMSASLITKLSQGTKNISLSKLISKYQIITENFLILFSTKQSIFGALALKKDSYSKQTASIFSVNNEKLVTKNSRVEATGLSIDYDDTLSIGSSHMKFKLASKVLAVKDNAVEYFNVYKKKEIYGSSYWRDELNIEINEFQIYRIYYK